MSTLQAKIAVAVPIYRDHLTPDEMFAWTTLQQRLADVPVYLVIGEARNAAAASPLTEIAGVATFPDAYFVSPQSYNALMFSRGLYEHFFELGFDWLLVHQLDALVFGDRHELDYFALGGAGPWHFFGAPLLTAPAQWREGLNGGLSLRSIASAIGVLRGRARWIDPDAYYHEFGVNEDLAWSVQVPRFLDGSFRPAPPFVAAKFAWECEPRAACELAQGFDPFGAHAWRRYDPDFYVERGLVPAEVAGTAAPV